MFNITYQNSDNSKFVVHRITGNHPIFTSRGWVQVSELFKGDKVFNSSLLCSDCGKKINIQINNSNLLKEQLCLKCFRKRNAKKQWKSEELKRIFNNHSKKYCLNKCEVIDVQKVNKNVKCNYLYNLSVEDDESYIADGIIVHNCRCTINYKDPDLEWDADLRAFVKVKKKTSTNPRLRGVKLNIKVSK